MRRHRRNVRLLRNFLIMLWENKFTIIIICLIFYSLLETKRVNRKLTEYVDMKFNTIVVDNLQSTTEPVIEKEIVTQTQMVLANNLDHSHYSRIVLDVKNIPQNPELPTGCEITSLAIVINYLNPETECDKLNLADNFLKQSDIGKTDPDEAFIGNPRNAKSFGANAPVLVDAAQNYYATVDLPRQVENLTGKEIEELLPCIISGYPVIVWGTINMADTKISTKWIVDGKEVLWHSNFHCLVLIGFDVEQNVYYFADPLNDGITAYDMDVFKDRYDKIGKQAIVVY